MNEFFHTLTVVFLCVLYAFALLALLDSPKEVK